MASADARRSDRGRRSDLTIGEAASRGLADAEARIGRLVDNGTLRPVGDGDDPFLVDRSTYLRHGGLINMVERRLAAWSLGHSPNVLAAACVGAGFRPDAMQSKAIVTAIERPLSIVHGGPGTGKSTIIRILARYLEAVDPARRQVVVAFAAKIALTTAARAGLAGTTLHAITGTRPDGEESATASIDPDIGTIYVDEAFAVPPGLLHRLLRLAGSDTRIVFLGDPNQLPPIGDGRALHDLLSHEWLPCVGLKTSHRLGADGHLARQAGHVAEGRVPRPGPGLEIATAPKAKSRDSDLAKAGYAIDLRRRSVEAGRRVIVLTTTRHGACGHEAVNRLVARSDLPTTGHQVITTERDRDGRWRNGQSGTVEEHADGMVKIAFDDGSATWTPADDKRIAFGYAMSVHRAQGLEYDHCILVLRRRDAPTLSRQALVSAMTRAALCTIIADEGVLATAVARDEIALRPPVIEAVLRKKNRGSKP